MYYLQPDENIEQFENDYNIKPFNTDLVDNIEYFGLSLGDAINAVKKVDPGQIKAADNILAQAKQTEKALAAAKQLEKTAAAAKQAEKTAAAAKAGEKVTGAADAAKAGDKAAGAADAAKAAEKATSAADTAKQAEKAAKAADNAKGIKQADKISDTAKQSKTLVADGEKMGKEASNINKFVEFAKKNKKLTAVGILATGVGIYAVAHGISFSDALVELGAKSIEELKPIAGAIVNVAGTGVSMIVESILKSLGIPEEYIPYVWYIIPILFCICLLMYCFG